MYGRMNEQNFDAARDGPRQRAHAFKDGRSQVTDPRLPKFQPKRVGVLR